MGLAQQWDQLNQLGMRIRHNLEQQIQARNQSGVSEDALKEFSMMFRHFDKDKTGRLDLNAFKSCLRALGYDLPMVEQDEPEPEFEQILLVVDPNKDGFVTLQDYMAFMISKETENVQSSEEIESAFRAITAQEREYVTQEELRSNLSKEMADYCIAKMKPYVDSHTGQGVTGDSSFLIYPPLSGLLWCSSLPSGPLSSHPTFHPRSPRLHGVHADPLHLVYTNTHQTFAALRVL